MGYARQILFFSSLDFSPNRPHSATKSALIKIKFAHARLIMKIRTNSKACLKRPFCVVEAQIDENLNQILLVFGYKNSVGPTQPLLGGVLDKKAITMFKNFWFALVSIVLCAGLWTCSNPPEYPDEPFIAFTGLSKSQILQSRGGGLPADTVIIRFSFRDGDGDLGGPDSTNIILKDSRDGFEHFFKINAIPKLGPGDGIEGEIAIQLTNSAVTRYFCCTFPGTRLTCINNPNVPTNVMSYSIRIRDRAGNWSNEITTSPITILCQ